MSTLISWDQANFSWNNNPFTWDDVKLVQRAVAGFDNEPWQNWKSKDKKQLVKLICKVQGKTIKEEKEINNYKIKVSDIKLLAEKVLGIEIITENIKF